MPRARALFGSPQADSFISAVIVLLVVYHLGGRLIEWAYFRATGHDRQSTPLGSPWTQ